MEKTPLSRAKYGSLEAGMAHYDAEMAKAQAKLNQDTSKELYRNRFCELARRLAAANTGQVLLIRDDFALWLEGYGEEFSFGDIEEGETSDYSPIYETYSYNSESYTLCNTKVNKAIMLHRANQLCHDLQEEHAARVAQAAEMGYPSNLHFLHRSVELGPCCQTWIIQANGLPRVRDYNVGNSEGREFHEGWMQLLPGEVIATWEKAHVSAPHYFKLELYIEATAIPKGVFRLFKRVPSSKLVHLILDSRMPALSIKKQKALQSLFPIAQLECLGDLQANLDCTCRETIDPIFGKPSPDIAGGWLGLLGIEQTYTIEVVEVEELDEEEDEEDEEEIGVG